MGYQFSGPSGLQFPASDLGPGDPSSSNCQKSISVSYWIKIEAIPSSSEYLFRYYSDSVWLFDFARKLNALRLKLIDLL